MGIERHAEDSHSGPGPTPKLIMAGRLDGFVDGRPVTLLADGGDLTLVSGSIRTLFGLRRMWRTVGGPLKTILAGLDIRLLVRVGLLGRLELLPNQSLLFRLILPRVYLPTEVS